MKSNEVDETVEVDFAPHPSVGKVTIWSTSLAGLQEGIGRVSDVSDGQHRDCHPLCDRILWISESFRPRFPQFRRKC